MEAKDVTVLPSALDQVIKEAKKEMLKNLLINTLLDQNHIVDKDVNIY